MFKERNALCLQINLSVNYMHGWKVAEARRNDECRSFHDINSDSWMWEEDALSVSLCLLAFFYK